LNLLLVRHGETQSNLKKIYSGNSLEGLNRKGIIQAKRVAEELKSFNIYALYSSPIQRAIQTALIIGEIINKEIIVENAFREMELGPWEGLAERDIVRKYPKEWKIWQSRPSKLMLPGRETLEQLLNRVLEGINKIYKPIGDKAVVIVTHVAIIRVLLLWYNKKKLDLYKKINVSNAEIFSIKINNNLLLNKKHLK
jgi:alpha-ribazole phosphatase/probable phosphoglycerate mutase